MFRASVGRYDKKVGLLQVMEDIVHSNITQCQFDFASLSILPVPDLAAIGITVTPLTEPAQEQAHWWSDLEYKRIPRTPGIYAIVNMLNGHFYIGSAVSLQNRKRQHFQSLQRGDHHSIYLQRAYDRYGADTFRFAIVERIPDKETLIEREQHYIDTLRPEYNISPTAGSSLGVKRSDEAKAKMSEAKKGFTHTEETKARISETTKGNTKSEATRAKMSEAQKGNTKSEGREVSEATRAILSEAKKGRPLSETHKANLSAAKKGKPAHNRGKTHSEETRRKISEAHKGKKRGPYSDTHKANISAALKGKPKSVNKSRKGQPLSLESVAKREATKREKRAIDPTYGKRKGKTAS